MASRRSRRRLGTGLLLLGCAALLLGIGFWFGGRMEARLRPAAPRVGSPPPVPAVKPVEELVKAARPATRPQVEEPAPTPATPRRESARIAIVIDDLGRSLAEVDRLEALGVPLSYAVLPFEPRTREIVQRLRGRRAEILCHLPMAARDGENAGPGAISAELPVRRIKRLTEAALDAVTGAVGVNNHMGSQVTADADAMRAILEVVGKRRLFFLDSRTTAESRAFELARAAGIPAARRTVFLDAEPGVEPVAEAFAELLAIARRDGAAIGIGHPRRTTFELLEREVPAALAAGFEFVPVSYLLESDEGLPE
ncbi:MAG TPA: divergent polysaccharide deacetylase family protein [Thermoanaerobaculia bacterium]|nr:divergent polysaccharide deacetylase family protein [Thermoanaerobaculia bacterium]